MWGAGRRLVADAPASKRAVVGALKRTDKALDDAREKAIYIAPGDPSDTSSWHYLDDAIPARSSLLRTLATAEQELADLAGRRELGGTVTGPSRELLDGVLQLRHEALFHYGADPASTYSRAVRERLADMRVKVGLAEKSARSFDWSNARRGFAQAQLRAAGDLDLVDLRFENAAKAQQVGLLQSRVFAKSEYERAVAERGRLLESLDERGRAVAARLDDNPDAVALRSAIEPVHAVRFDQQAGVRELREAEVPLSELLRRSRDGVDHEYVVGRGVDATGLLRGEFSFPTNEKLVNQLRKRLSSARDAVEASAPHAERLDRSLQQITRVQASLTTGTSHGSDARNTVERTLKEVLEDVNDMAPELRAVSAEQVMKSAHLRAEAAALDEGVSAIREATDVVNGQIATLRDRQDALLESSSLDSQLAELRAAVGAG